MESRAHFPDEPTFPACLHKILRESKDGPRPLRTRGAWPAPDGVAIVGTRDASEEALAFTRRLAAAIVGAGWSVWSGGARGIDTAAHEGALDAGGVTIVVRPSGLDETYPPENAALFDRVLSCGGALVSPFADDARPTLRSFYLRNAVLAALSFATVVVQAGEKSGARNTARCARALVRPLLVVPQSPWDPRGRGCAIEIARGAVPIVDEASLVKELRRMRPVAREHALLVAREHAQPVAREHAQPVAREGAHTHALHNLDDVTTAVLASISEVPIHMDDLCERAALPVSAVGAALLTLTLGAVVVEAPAGYYRRLPTI
ncbi:MAG: DNA-processing protein DprA [Polyangiaceae bacterium]